MSLPESEFAAVVVDEEIGGLEEDHAEEGDVVGVGRDEGGDHELDFVGGGDGVAIVVPLKVGLDELVVGNRDGKRGVDRDTEVASVAGWWRDWLVDRAIVRRSCGEKTHALLTG